MATLGKEQFGIVFVSAGAELQYTKLPIPKVAPDNVLVNIKYSGVCHSDLHIWKGIPAEFRGNRR